MFPTSSRLLSVSVAAALLAACGGGGGSSGGSSSMLNSTPQSGNVAMLLSDASSEDWATIGVKVLSIALVPQGGGSNVTVYTAPTPAPVVNLVQLDQIAELLGNSTVPVGTYTGAVLTVSGNAGDILLTVSADPEVGFAAAPGTTIPANQIQVQHTQGERLQPHGTGKRHVRFAAGREREPEQCARPRIRSCASRLPGRPRAGGNGRHHLGGQFQRTGASPSAA